MKLSRLPNIQFQLHWLPKLLINRKARYLIPIVVLMNISLKVSAIERDTLRGTIVDSLNKRPLIGVLIGLKNTQKAVYTNQHGQFKMAVPGGMNVVVFSFKGYRNKEMVVLNRKELYVQLVREAALLKGIESADKRVGQGQTAALNTTSEKNLHSLTEVHIDQALQGRVQTIRIRGTNTFMASSSPSDNESYRTFSENRFLTSKDNPLSTFGIDVDAASYSNIRRFINRGQLPPADAVRVEEMINYFNYSYPQPKEKQPFSVNTEITEAPWNKQHKLVRIGLQGLKEETSKLPASNLVFLVDVSGSMNSPEKLPLLKSSLKMLTDQLRDKDKVAIVVYAGAAGLVLPATSGEDKQKIKDAIEGLSAGGSTAGGEGIKLAYKTAQDHFIKNGNNRVILATDGDFNVGVSSDAEMQHLIEKERESGIFLSVLGFGTGNYKDSKMETLADKGNGNYAYIDNINEARKVLVNEFGGTLFTIAKDVKLQIEFNPDKVKAYRLIGYENKLLNKEDFNNDKKDAGDLGAGHIVTALYEVIPEGVNSRFIENVDKLKYQKEKTVAKSGSSEILTVKLRYKKPNENISQLIEKPVINTGISWEQASDDFRFATSVAAFGMLLKNSEFKQETTFDKVIEWSKGALGDDEEGYRKEFVNLIKSAKLLQAPELSLKKE